MVFQEFGLGRGEVVLLLHGGGLSWWNYREAASLLEGEFHVVLPVLDGHADSDRPFVSIEDNAAEIIALIDERFGGHVALIGGLSLGGQVLLEMLSQRGDICAHALVESAAVIPQKLTSALVGPAFGSSYGLIRNRAFAKLQFDSLRMKAELFEDYYRDTCRIAKGDMIAFMKASTSYALKDAFGGASAKVRVCYGDKENSVIRRSAAAIVRAMPSAGIRPLPGLRHGEFSINHAVDYAKAVREMIRG